MSRNESKLVIITFVISNKIWEKSSDMAHHSHSPTRLDGRDGGRGLFRNLYKNESRQERKC